MTFIVLLVLLLVPDSVHAYLHVTAAEITNWQTRASSGPYASQYTTMVSRADSLISAPPTAWSARTSGGCWVRDGSDTTPGRTLERETRDAGLVYLISGDTKYRDAVIARLLAQAAIAGTNAATNTSVWCSSAYFEERWFEIANWLRRLLFAYDYVRPVMTAPNVATMDAWFLAWANFFNSGIMDSLTDRFSGRASDNYTCTGGAGFCPGSNNGITHFGGPTVFNFHEGWNNVIATGHAFMMDVGIMQGNTTLINSAKRYFHEVFKYAVFPGGIVNEQKRWSDAGVPQTGYLYEGTHLGTLIAMADHLARNGDTSLYDYSTEVGLHGSDSPGNPKSLLQSLQHYAGLTNGTTIQYASTTSTTNPALIIDSSGTSNQYINFISLAQANMYYNDSAVRTASLTTLSGTPFAGGYDPLGGDWGTMSMVLFQFGDMEDNLANPFLGAPPPSGSGHLELRVIRKLQ